MKKPFKNLCALGLSILLLSACNPEMDQINQVEPEEVAENLSIPAGFDFKTDQNVSITINDAEYAKYDVYAYSDQLGETVSEADVLEKLIFSGITKNGALQQTINLPKFYNKVYIRRNGESTFSSTSLTINNQEVTYNNAEYKSTTTSSSQKSANAVDTDGDGVLDTDDAYPQDPEKAFNMYTPSEGSYGSIAFEDLWPSTGDYDFNDVAFRYHAKVHLNADNLAVGFDFTYQITTNNTTGINGIGFEIEGLAPDQIKSVSGQEFSRNFINVNANGTEANQENAVIILTDDVWNLPHNYEYVSEDTDLITDAGDFEKVTVSVKFTAPIATNDMGIAPFNPFLILNIDTYYTIFMSESNDPRYPKGLVRDFEAHLPNMKPTTLGLSMKNTKDHASNYIADNGFPWAIHVMDSFSPPKPGIAITEAYNNFKAWAESGGTDHKDWYINEVAGNINKESIY